MGDSDNSRTEDINPKFRLSEQDVDFLNSMGVSSDVGDKYSIISAIDDQTLGYFLRRETIKGKVHSLYMYALNNKNSDNSLIPVDTYAGLLARFVDESNVHSQDAIKIYEEIDTIKDDSITRADGVVPERILDLIERLR
ncbi:hypothetical protein GOV11_04075 [Candidatus Woesearchaeota archaeon]|nr:hypothetical protein [Candidatus Woesearchaeota archaeon]